jgi:hypothetical protein
VVGGSYISGISSIDATFAQSDWLSYHSMVTYFRLKEIGVGSSVDLFGCLRYITKNIQNMDAKR